MADRSIEEIVGPDYVNGCDCSENEYATVDDLLAWLNREHGIQSIEVYADPAVSAAEVEGWNVYCNEDDWWINTSGPTLLEALEAAVRSVAQTQSDDG